MQYIGDMIILNLYSTPLPPGLIVTYDGFVGVPTNIGRYNVTFYYQPQLGELETLNVEFVIYDRMELFYYTAQNGISLLPDAYYYIPLISDIDKLKYYLYIIINRNDSFIMD